MDFLQVTVGSFKEGIDAPEFGIVQITIPKDVFTYPPDTNVEMMTFGGSSTDLLSWMAEQRN